MAYGSGYAVTSYSATEGEQPGAVAGTHAPSSEHHIVLGFSTSARKQSQRHTEHNIVLGFSCKAELFGGIGGVPAKSSPSRWIEESGTTGTWNPDTPVI